MTPLETARILILIGASRFLMVVFGYRAFEAYLRGSSARAAVTDTAISAIGWLIARRIVADDELANLSLVANLLGLLVGTWCAATERNLNEGMKDDETADPDRPDT